jgi:phosphoglycerate dehydrogenase-like enzyme
VGGAFMTTCQVVDRYIRRRDSASTGQLLQRPRAQRGRRVPERGWTMKVAFAGSFAGRIAEPVRARLSLPCEVVVDDEAGIIPQLTDVDVLVSMGFSARMAEAAPRLRLVQVPGAGLDRINLDALPPGAWLANAYGHEVGIAEYVIGAMIAITRSFGPLDTKLREGHWESQWAVGSPTPPLWPELAGKRLGILGFGHIGQALARRAVAFDMQVCAIRQQAEAQTPNGLSFVGGPERLDDILQQADYLAVTLSLSPATRGLLDDRRLRLMKRTAFLINVARAEILDEKALYGALASGRLAGAAFDVWWHYPSSAEPTLPATQPFHELGNVLMTPHVSGWTEGMLDARATLIATNIERIARGEPPLNLIDLAL